MVLSSWILCNINIYIFFCNCILKGIFPKQILTKNNPLLFDYPFLNWVFSRPSRTLRITLRLKD